MPLLGRKTEEEKAARAAQKQADNAASTARKRAEREAKAREKLRGAFYSSPAGQARVAFESGAKVFQYEASVKDMQAVVRPLGFGASATARETNASRISRGPVATLNAVCDEGWELVNGSFVFVETGQQSRDKFMASGQQVAVSGTVVGYYLFRRNETNKANLKDPWDASEWEAVALADEIA
jgi:hypothetical protein